MSTVIDETAGSQDAEVPLAQLDWETASQASTLITQEPSIFKPLCSKCGFEVDIFRAQLKNKSRDNPKFICRDCNCISACLSRNLDLSTLKLSSLSPPAYQQFWRNCAKQREGMDYFRYSKIKACVVESLTVERVSQASVVVSEEALPLGVWKQRGFDVGLIESLAATETHPILGLCYKVPLKTSNREEIARSIQAEVMNAERVLKKPKALSSKADQSEQAEQSEHANADDDVVCLDDFESSDDCAEPSAKGAKLNSGNKGNKKAANPAKEAASQAKSEAKKAELLKKKQRAEAEKANQKIFVLATKTMGAVSAVLVELEQAKKNTSPHIPDWITEKLDDCFIHLQQYKTESQDRLSKSGKAAAKGVELEKLDFTQADVADYVKTAVQFLGKYKKMQSII
jgi:hypothetical protein